MSQGCPPSPFHNSSITITKPAGFVVVLPSSLSGGGCLGSKMPVGIETAMVFFNGERVRRTLSRGRRALPALLSRRDENEDPVGSFVGDCSLPGYLLLHHEHALAPGVAKGIDRIWVDSNHGSFQRVVLLRNFAIEGGGLFCGLSHS